MTQLYVTAFRTFLTCPYRFYLRHILKLEAIDDEMEELEAAAFGSLMHVVLDRFGTSDLRNSTDVDTIVKFLNAQLDACVLEQFGSQRLAPVNLQVRQLRARLAAFANCQVAWAADGWTIKHTEQKFVVAPAKFQVDGHTFEICGRIDRIDYNNRTGQWAILDYKSSDAAKIPDVTHRRNKEWIDLQLPLYRHLASACGVPPNAALGYILLPKDTARASVSLVDWTEAELEEADQKAIDIIRAIHAQDYWPPTERPPFEDEFMSVCQDKVFHRQLAELLAATKS